MAHHSARTAALGSAATLALIASAVTLGAPALAKDTSYKTSIDIVPGEGPDTPETVSGVVFTDVNRDGTRQDGEAGVAGVMVSNGQEVVVTDNDGAYELPAYEDMSVFVTKPAGYDVPVDEDNIPQFSYQHKPAGSPPLRFGGLEPTGPLPAAINFPLIESPQDDQFSCVIMGDTQPYSNTEIGYVRDTVAAELAAADLSDYECVIFEGDVMGDDLGLYPRFKSIMSVADTPIYFVGGNHDIDFDAPSDQHSFDTFRREFGPAYYSFDIGQVHFVVLDNVVYPCTNEVDNADGRHEFCNDPEARTYNGRVDDMQMEWLENDLAHVPEDKLVVLNMHIPLVTFMDNEATKHQTDNAAAIYAALEGRPALALSGHTHTLEQIRTGESYEGWEEVVGVGPSPFPQIVTGAPSGSWWSGDLDRAGMPMSLQRLGGPRGYLLFDFDGNTYQDHFKASGQSIEAQMSIGIDSPVFREWYSKMYDWMASYIDEEEGENFEERTKATPPVNVNDLGDTKILTPHALEAGTFLTVNVWNGSKEATVEVSINGGEPIAALRTQEGEGEEVREGVEYADPFAVVRQMQVARYAFASASDEARNQGFELWTGAKFFGDPQPLQEWMLADQSIHLWKAELPADLPMGAHEATVTVTDHFDRTFTSTIAFEVMEEVPPMRFRSELFE